MKAAPSCALTSKAAIGMSVSSSEIAMIVARNFSKLLLIIVITSSPLANYLIGKNQGNVFFNNKTIIVIVFIKDSSLICLIRIP